jgi:hypothetical protein
MRRHWHALAVSSALTNPVEERYGPVFVYMGPPDREPALPRYDCMEPLEEGDQYFAEMPGPVNNVTGMAQDFNWLQIWENAIALSTQPGSPTNTVALSLAVRAVPDSLWIGGLVGLLKNPVYISAHQLALS